MPAQIQMTDDDFKKAIARFEEAYDSFGKICHDACSLILLQDKNSFFTNSAIFIFKDFYVDAENMPCENDLYVYTEAYGTYVYFKFDMKKVFAHELAEDDFANSILRKRDLKKLRQAQNKTHALWQKWKAENKIGDSSNDGTHEKHSEEEKEIIKHVADAQLQNILMYVLREAVKNNVETDDLKRIFKLTTEDFNKSAMEFALAVKVAEKQRKTYMAMK